MNLSFAALPVLLAQAAESVDAAIATAKKASDMGANAITWFMVIGLIIFGVYQERQRRQRDAERKADLQSVIAHHEAFVNQAKVERTEINEERRGMIQQLITVNVETTKSMDGMAAAVNGLKEFLKERLK